MASQRTAAAPSPSRIPAVRQPSGQPAPQAQPSGIQRADSGRPGTPQVASRTPGAGTATNTRVASGVPQSAVAPQRVASGVPSSAQPVRQNPSAVPSRTNTGLGTNVAPTRTAVVPVTRQPSGVPASATATNPQPRTRAPTGNSSDVAPRAAPTATNPASAQQRTASGVAAPQQRTPTGQSSTQPSQQAQAASRAVSRARRVSKVIVEKEKKTGYWQEIIEEARHDHPELSQEDVNAMIARCLALDLVANWKTRETQGNGPRAQELFQQLERTMEAKLVQCNGGRPFPVPGSGFTKIKNMERQLQTFEAKQDKDQEEEAEKVKAKIADLSKSLSHLQQKKDQEREANRRTMTMEINNLREQMQKAATEPQNDQARMIEENKKMAQKMMRLEAALRQMNEEKTKGVEDNDSAMLKKKLALFEARMKQLEEEKKIRESEESADLMKDKLLLMEEKLAKMERRKSVSLTMMMQQKMQQVEEQLSTLRNTGGGGSSAKIQELEKKLVEMQNTKVNPSMINDPETRALRSHVKKMEEAMLAAERKMEEDRQKLEEERHAQAQKRQREEEAYRKKAQQREQLLLDKMAEMEKRISANKGGGGGGGSGGSAGMDAAIQKRMEEMEKRLAGGGAFAEQMAAMERRLQESEARLAKEQQTSQILMSVLGEKDGPALDDAQKDIKIAFLTQSTQDLMKRLEETAKAMDTKFAEVTKKIDTMQFSGGGAPAHQHKSGLTYAEINQKLEEIQKKLFDPDIEERESEQLNIEYEKLISELEGTAEYKAEQEQMAKKWKDENTPLNNAALDRVRGEIAGWTPMKKTAQLKRKPELKFLDFTPDQINKKHVNDFKGVTTQNLTLDEARALYACMPEFRKDQEAQLQFVEQLKTKIEVDAKKPAVKPPPPIQAKKPVVMKKPPPAKGGGGGGDFLAELLQKRKAVG